jgi:hypothetical protein
MRAPATIIPESAREIVEDTFASGLTRSAFYELDGERVGFRCWHEDGSLAMEYVLRGGVMHGPYRTFWDSGQVHEEATYVDGKEHGVTRQYDDAGALIGSYTMNYGTGVDLWFERAGVLAEERHYLDGQRHGYERWWWDDNATVWQEEHYRHGEPHGIIRQWNDQRRLCRGFPRCRPSSPRTTCPAEHFPRPFAPRRALRTHRLSRRTFEQARLSRAYGESVSLKLWDRIMSIPLRRLRDAPTVAG